MEEPPLDIRRDDGAAAPRKNAAAAALRRLGPAGPPTGCAQGAGRGGLRRWSSLPKKYGKQRETQVEKKAHLGYLG